MENRGHQADSHTHSDMVMTPPLTRDPGADVKSLTDGLCRYHLLHTPWGWDFQEDLTGNKEAACLRMSEGV